jgi:squalene-hopene/tetraprenyl-beta-curcumene cyclase
MAMGVVAVSRLLLIAVLAAASPTFVVGDELVQRIDTALGQAGVYLVSTQDDDGAWRSQAYASLRGGPALTPYVLSSLFYLPQTGTPAVSSYRKGVGYLLRFVDENGHIRADAPEMLYPVYTTTMASRVVPLLDRDSANLTARRAFLDFVRGRQLTEQLGWNRDDPEYGGWGFSIVVPRKPPPDEPRDRFLDSNLSATLFGLAALRSADVAVDDPAFGKALVFVRRCQNFSDDPQRRDPGFDDGGFFFMPGDMYQNKAGVAGEDRFGRERYHSYGTMTADGLRALVRCGLPADHPRAVAARRWLERHFSATDNPGQWEPDRAVLQNATYYYWAWSVSHAFMGLSIEQIETAEGKVRWAEVMANELIRRQKHDGSWTNQYTDSREDDPLVATPWAAAALAVCRYVITGEQRLLAAAERGAVISNQ